MRTVFFVTGVPGVGKSSLCRALATNYPHLYEHVPFGVLILEAIRRQGGTSVDEPGLRRNSLELVTSDVLDQAIADLCRQLAAEALQETAIVIDSHAVSQQGAVFSASPDGIEYFSRVRYAAIVHLTCSPSVVLERSNGPESGRQARSPEDVEAHDALQRSVTLLYSSLSKCPAYFVDASAGMDAVAGQVHELLSRHAPWQSP